MFWSKNGMRLTDDSRFSQFYTSRGTQLGAAVQADISSRVASLTAAAVLAFCLIALTACGGGGSAQAPSPNSDAQQQASGGAMSSEDTGAEASADGQDAKDKGEQTANSDATNENMPVPDFSKLFTLSRAEAADYLASYPHDESEGEELVDLIGWASFYSSDAVKEKIHSSYRADHDLWDAGSWSMTLFYSDDADTCEYINFYMPPFSSSSDTLVPSETYAAMIKSYLAGFGIQEMTVAVQDWQSGRSDGNFANDFDGYVLFDDLQLQARVGSFDLKIWPNPGPSSWVSWEEVKSWVSQGYYLDKHSGGVTYTIPYIDVYSTASDL